MSFKRKLIVVAIASVLPWASAQAQSTADLQKEIQALRAQLQLLQQKIEAVSARSESSEISQQVTRIEQKIDLADDDAIKSGLKGLKFKGTIEAAYRYDSTSKVNSFKAQGGNYDELAMLELSKETDGGEGVNWMLRLAPGGSSLVHEATVSFPMANGSRVYGGVIPDFQGYEYAWANQNPLLTHNALFDFAGPATYAGVGMTHALTKEVALKWMVGNIDGANDDTALGAAAGSKRSVGLAYRFDWTLSEYAYLGLAGAHGTKYRHFNVIALDGGFTRGDWLFNGHVNFGDLKGGAYNGGDARWMGVSALAGFKITPRLQLLARADYLMNGDNGGGTYVSNYFNIAYDSTATNPEALGGGLGPERNSDGTLVDQINPKGANLTRITLGTNYLINPSTQWKTELRFDRSTGANFVDGSGIGRSTSTSIGTSFVVSF